MAGRINAEDVATVKERSSIEDIVREHVTCARPGSGPSGPVSLPRREDAELQRPAIAGHLSLLRMR